MAGLTLSIKHILLLNFGLREFLHYYGPFGCYFDLVGINGFFVNKDRNFFHGHLCYQFCGSWEGLTPFLLMSFDVAGRLTMIKVQSLVSL